MEKKGAIELTSTTAVISILSIAIIILGVVLIENLRVELPEFETGMPQFFSADVFPLEGQQGTVFKVKIDFTDDELVYFAQAHVKQEGGIIETIPLYDDGSHGDFSRGDGIYAGVFDSAEVGEGFYDVDLVINPSESEIAYEDIGRFLVYKDNCIPLVYNGDPEEKIDVVILPDSYEDFDKFRKDALKLIGFPEKYNGILTYEPFTTYANKFNFYIVNQTVKTGCRKGCQGVESLVCCNNDLITQSASQCPADQVFVLLDNKDFCGSASSYAKVCNGWNHGQVGTHEFGHTFGGLGDEYVYSDVYPGFEGVLTIYPNCDVLECPKWATFWPGCVDGCGVSNLNRPTNKNCLMYTYTDEFDKVDQRHMVSLLDEYRSGEVQEIAAPPLEKTYLVGVNYDKGKLSTNNVYLTQSKAPDRKFLNRVNYIGKILDFNGRTLNTFRFDIPRLEVPAMPRSEDEPAPSPVVLNDTNYTVSTEYFEDAQKMEIYDLKNNKLLTVDLGYFADVCGDGVCQPQESNLNCAEDCPGSLPDDICNYESDEVCDPDCRVLDPDCGFTRENLYLILGAIVAVFVVTAALTTKKRKR